MKLFHYGKKGSATDAITVPAFILVVATTALIMLYVWFSFQDAMLPAAAASPSNSTIVEVMDSLRATYTSLDYMMPLLVGGLLLVSLIFAFKTGASIIYGFVSIFIWGFALLMSSVYSNIFEEFVTAFPSAAAEMPILVFIMTNMRWIVLVWLLLISIVMFTRNKREEQQIMSAEVAYG